METVLDLLVRLVDGLFRFTRWSSSRRGASLAREREVRLEALLANRRLGLSDPPEPGDADRP